MSTDEQMVRYRISVILSIDEPDWYFRWWHRQIRSRWTKPDRPVSRRNRINFRSFLNVLLHKSGATFSSRCRWNFRSEELVGIFGPNAQNSNMNMKQFDHISSHRGPALFVIKFKILQEDVKPDHYVHSRWLPRNGQDQEDLENSFQIQLVTEKSLL